MTMSPALRKLALTVHLVLSIGWIGAVIVYIALNVAAVTSSDSQVVRAGLIGMDLTARFVIVPLALTSFISGLVMSLGTPWGLFRYYWVLISFVLTAFAVIVLLLHMPDVSALTATAIPTGAAEQHGSGRGDFLHAGGGLFVLIVITVLNVYKPRGMTRYGWRWRVASSRRGGAVGEPGVD
jgi:hypothetical protein